MSHSDVTRTKASGRSISGSATAESTKTRRSTKTSMRTPDTKSPASRSRTSSPRHTSSRAHSKRRTITTSHSHHNHRNHLKVSICLIIAAIAAAAAFFIYDSPLKYSFRPGEGAKVPMGYGLYAVDLSHYNDGKIVWDSLRVMIDSRGYTTRSAEKAYSVTPVSYVIFKASEGNTMKDKQFKSYWKDAGKAGVRRGAYHFYRSSKDPRTQARNFIKATGKLKESDLPPILDIETTHKGYSRKALNENALIWLQTVEKHYGRKPIVYSSDSFISNILSDRIKQTYPLWVARYHDKEPENGNWYMWQFTDKAVVYGIDGYVDLNVIRSGMLE